MKVQYQVIEDGSEIELFSTMDHKEASANFGEFQKAPCRTEGDTITINGHERIISRIGFGLDYVKGIDLKLIIEVEQI